jgi:Uma2 family endonuclease
VDILERLYTVAEFEAFLSLPENIDRLLELIHGEISEKMPTEQHGLVVGNFVTSLNLYARRHKNGRVGTEVRHQRADDLHNSRLPDVSFHMTKRPLVTEGSVLEFPVLVIEVQSPDDSIQKMREKAQYYLANGTLLVWLVYPKKRVIEVYHANGDIQILVEGDMLTGGDMLPGFSMPVSEVFMDPLGDAE